jgi:hypothetical protein
MVPDLQARDAPYGEAPRPCGYVGNESRFNAKDFLEDEQ